MVRLSENEQPDGSTLHPRPRNFPTPKSQNHYVQIAQSQQPQATPPHPTLDSLDPITLQALPSTPKKRVEGPGRLKAEFAGLSGKCVKPRLLNL